MKFWEKLESKSSYHFPNSWWFRGEIGIDVEYVDNDFETFILHATSLKVFVYVFYEKFVFLIVKILRPGILTDNWCNSYDWDAIVTTTYTSPLRQLSGYWIKRLEVCRSPEMCVVRRGEADCQLMAADVDTITKIQNWAHRLHTSIYS